MDIVVFVTTKNVSQAKAISRALVASHAIACANILPKVSSIFWWQGKAERSSEALIIMKTKKSCFKKNCQHS